MFRLLQPSYYLKQKDNADFDLKFKYNMKKILIIALTFITSTLSFAQLSESKLDDVVTRTMKAFNVPGIAVAIVKDGKIVISKGYGVTNINTQQKVDGNTLFGIASNSKSFTNATLGMLV